MIPVDGQTGSTEVGTAGETQSVSFRQVSVALFPAAALDHRFDAFAQPHRTDLEPVRGHTVGRHQLLHAHLRRIEPQAVGDLVEVHFKGETRLRSPVAPLRATGSLVGEGTDTVEAILGKVVGHRLQGTGVVGARHSVAAVGSTVEGGLQVLGGQGAILLDPGADLHEHRVASAVAVEDLFAGEADLDGASQFQRHLGGTDFMVEGITLAAETATIWTGDDSNPRSGQFENLGQRAMQVVRGLRGRVDRDPIDLFGQSDSRMLLHRQVRVAFEVHDVLEDFIRFLKAGVGIAELHRQFLVQVAFVAVVVNPRFRSGDRFLNRGDGLERFVLDLDGEGCFVGLLFRESGNCHHRVTNEAYLVDTEGVFVLTHRQDSKGIRHRFTGEESEDSRHLLRFGEIDVDDACVRNRRAHQFHVNHARETEVVGESGLTGDLGAAVDTSERLADQVEITSGRGLALVLLLGGIQGLMHGSPPLLAGDRRKSLPSEGCNRCPRAFWRQPTRCPQGSCGNRCNGTGFLPMPRRSHRGSAPGSLPAEPWQ